MPADIFLHQVPEEQRGAKLPQGAPEVALELAPEHELAIAVGVAHLEPARLARQRHDAREVEPQARILQERDLADAPLFLLWARKG